MRKRSARTAALSLSTITLASSLAFPIYAEASEDSESLVSAPETETVVDTPAKEEAAVDNADEFSSEESVDSITPAIDAAVEADLLDESFLDQSNEIDNDNQQVVESIDSAAESIENIQKSAEAMDEAEAAAEDIVAEAAQITEDVKNTTEQAVNTVNEAASIVADDTADRQTVDIAVETAQTTVDEAKEQFDSAKASYDEKLAEYEAAKDDYETAAKAYDTNKANATEDLEAAKEALDDAKNRLSELKEQLEAAQQELVNSGASALLAADQNRDEDVVSYVASVIEHYYVPNTQLSEDQQISNFTVTPSDSDFVSISYDLLDADGNFLRNVTADYGYTVDKTTGDIHIYDNNLVYTYTNADGSEVELTKEEASQLKDGQIAIGTYWTATGFYIPRYQDVDVNYKGIYIGVRDYTDAKAIVQGQNGLKNLYDSQKSKYYNSRADFAYGWKTQYPNFVDLNIFYNVSYDKVSVYQAIQVKGATLKTYRDYVSEIETNGGVILSSEEEFISSGGTIRYIQGYKLSDAIQNTHYSSYGKVLEAISTQAAKDQGAYGVDIANSSNLFILQQTEYARLQAVHKNSIELLSSVDKGYGAYISEVSNKLATYSLLLKEIESAKAEYEQAQNKVIKLQQQIEALDKTNDIDVAERLTRLEIELEKAKSNYDTAKENLEEATNILAEVKELYNNRFSVTASEDTSSDDSQEATVTYPLIQLPETEELVLEEELAEEEPAVISFGGSGSANAGGEAIEITLPELILPEAPQTESTTIPDEETPQAITLAGLLQRGKWFVGLAGASTAGVGVAALEAKRRAAIKLIDKLNQ